MPARPALRNRVCSGNLARSLTLIPPQCEGSHCLSSTRIWASMDTTLALRWMRPIKSNQWVSGLLISSFSVANGIKKSGGSLRKVSPKKAGGVIPTTVNGLSLKFKDTADDGRIQSVFLLPQAVAHHRDGQRTGPIIIRVQHSPSIRIDTEHLEIIAGY